MTVLPATCACTAPFVVVDDRDEPACLKCGRRPAPEPCSCRAPARSPRADGPDFCRTCKRPIHHDATVHLPLARPDQEVSP